MDSPGLALNISAVERETGLSKDVLRMWERRYGFPTPARDDNARTVVMAPGPASSGMASGTTTRSWALWGTSSC